MTTDQISLLNGGRAVIVGGRDKDWQEYRRHPQFMFWSGEQKDVLRQVNNKDLPDNCKLLVISRFISHSQIEKLVVEARKRQIPIVGNKNDGEITNILEDLITPILKQNNNVNPEIKVSNHGKLKALMPMINFAKSNVENARALYIKAKEMNISTTENSLAQYIGKERQRQQGGTVPKSVRNKLDVTVEMLDAIVKDISGMRDYLIELTEENRELRKRVDKFKKALED